MLGCSLRIQFRQSANWFVVYFFVFKIARNCFLNRSFLLHVIFQSADFLLHGSDLTSPRRHSHHIIVLSHFYFIITKFELFRKLFFFYFLNQTQDSNLDPPIYVTSCRHMTGIQRSNPLHYWWLHSGEIGVKSGTFFAK